MKSHETPRGFRVLTHPSYIGKVDTRLVQESSAIGDYKDSMAQPGSSFLWVGDAHHLNREEVAELVKRMQHWLKRGRLKVDRK